MWRRGFNDFPVWHFDVVQEACAGAVSLTPRVSRVGPQLGLGDFVLAPERVEDAALGWVEFVQA